MHKKVKSRLVNLVLIIIITSGFLGLILKNLNENISFYFTPTEILTKKYITTARLGGVVKKNSLITNDNGLIEFIVTDYKNEIKVNYKGILPDIFREGQGVVAIGKVENTNFVASKILAKHDENYVAVKTDYKE